MEILVAVAVVLIATWAITQPFHTGGHGDANDVTRDVCIAETHNEHTGSCGFNILCVVVMVTFWAVLIAAFNAPGDPIHTATYHFQEHLLWIETPAPFAWEGRAR